MAKNFNSWPEQWPKSLNYPKQPVYSFLDHTAARIPNRLAIIFGGMEITYGELKELADRFANALVFMGLKKGEKVAIHLLNCPQFAIAYYGILKVGAVFTPVSPLLSSQEAKCQLIDSAAKILISADSLYPNIDPIVSETNIEKIIVTSITDRFNPANQSVKQFENTNLPDAIDMAQLLKCHAPEVPEIEIDVFNDLAHLAYTGGTTGVAKGVMLTHYNVVANCIQYGSWLTGAQIEVVDDVPTSIFPPGVNPIRDRLISKDQETALVVVPWFHAMGTVGYLNNLIYGGTTMVVFADFEPKKYLDAIPRYKATALGGAPQLFIPLVNHTEFHSYDLSGIKLVTSGAASLPESVLEKILRSFSGVVCEAYGLTECTMGATANPPDRSKIRAGSIGLPVFDTECKVVDLETGGDLPSGKEGEICIKGPQVMQGYWKNAEETSEVLKSEWLYTGDIGKKDEDGYFYITDRKKDMIIYKGYNVYPRELEEVLFKHWAVEQCAVVGKPDMEAGEIPVAFVQLRRAGQTTAEEIMAYINPQVAAYKKIRKIEFLDAIPISPVGKILKRKLREMLKTE